MGPTLRGDIALVSAVQRAGGRLRPGRARPPGPPGSRGVGRSTARRCGPRWPPVPTWASVWPGPTRTCPSTVASPTSWSTCTHRASRSGPCGRSPARPCSTRSSSTGASSPTTAWWVRWTAAGAWPGPRWPTSGSRCRRTRPSAGRSEGVLARVTGRPDADRIRSPSTGSGDLVAEAQSLAQLGMRATLRSVGGLQPGPESSVRKLLGAEFEQRVHEFGLDWAGPDGAVTVGDAAMSAHGVLHSKCLTIAGGRARCSATLSGSACSGCPGTPSRDGDLSATESGRMPACGRAPNTRTMVPRPHR